MHHAPIKTPLGTFTAWFTERGLVRLDFPADRKPARSDPAPGRERQTPLAGRALDHWRDLTTRAVNAVLAGRAPRRLPPLDWTAGTGFQRRVWAELCRLAPGETRTYAQLAAALGQPRAARAVGGACGANPIPVLVPCHRVTAAGGGLGGFSAGLAWKRRLLAIEGAGTSSA
jgi:O-6-methylguanine DNA methyltransferase